ncbi:hypothetical protein pb186bvf_003967 [Paramecium bursaria]
MLVNTNQFIIEEQIVEKTIITQKELNYYKDKVQTQENYTENSNKLEFVVDYIPKQFTLYSYEMIKDYLNTQEFIEEQLLIKIFKKCIKWENVKTQPDLDQELIAKVGNPTQLFDIMKKLVNHNVSSLYTFEDFKFTSIEIERIIKEMDFLLKLSLFTPLIQFQKLLHWIQIVVQNNFLVLQTNNNINKQLKDLANTLQTQLDFQNAIQKVKEYIQYDNQLPKDQGLAQNIEITHIYF